MEKNATGLITTRIGGFYKIALNDGESLAPFNIALCLTSA